MHFDCEMAAISFRPHCVNADSISPLYDQVEVRTVLKNEISITQRRKNLLVEHSLNSLLIFKSLKNWSMV